MFDRKGRSAEERYPVSSPFLPHQNQPTNQIQKQKMKKVTIIPPLMALFCSAAFVPQRPGQRVAGFQSSVK
jgi:hypothetical protein